MVHLVTVTLISISKVTVAPVTHGHAQLLNTPKLLHNTPQLPRGWALQTNGRELKGRSTARLRDYTVRREATYSIVKKS